VYSLVEKNSSQVSTKIEPQQLPLDHARRTNPDADAPGHGAARARRCRHPARDRDGVCGHCRIRLAVHAVCSRLLGIAGQAHAPPWPGACACRWRPASGRSGPYFAMACSNRWSTNSSRPCASPPARWMPKNRKKQQRAQGKSRDW